MCGRYALTLPHDAVANWFGATSKGSFQDPQFNICPSQPVPVAVHYEGDMLLTPMRWGFVPNWYDSPNGGPILINARSETVQEKPAFRSAIAKRRCIIPASGFYEWHREHGEKTPWYFSPTKSELMGFAGIWQVWTGSDGLRVVSCAMLTMDAGPQMSDIHHREPVVIEQDRQMDWLAGDLDLIKPAPDNFYKRHKVSKAVNKNTSRGSELIEPI